MNNPLKEFISNGSISIDENNWQRLNQLYSMEELMTFLKEEILANNISLPLKKITIDDAKDSFISLLNYQCSDFKNDFLTTRYDYTFDKLQCGRYIDETNVGNVASDYFQQYNRFCCGSINSPSPVRTWSNDKFLNGMLKAIWSLKCKSINDNTFRTCLALRKYVASQFKPTIAKSIYEKFGSQDVLDFSAGWGDRLCGFYACDNTKSYIGIDPNKNVHDGYQKQVELYSEYVPDKKTTFICSPAEDVELSSEFVDTVFTSPPYFNVEKYSNDESQSYKRYRKLDKWLSGFLFKAIDTSVRALKKDGYLIINISDVYSNHQINNICDPMNYHIQSLGLKYEGVIGMKMAKRPNSNAVKDGVFVEPIWIWRK